MIHVLEHVAAMAGIIVPFGISMYVLLGKSPDDESDGSDIVAAAFEAEKQADARLQPFNGGAR